MKQQKQPSRTGSVKITLLYVGNMVCPVDYIDPEDDEVIDKLLKPITVSKSKVPCG